MKITMTKKEYSAMMDLVKEVMPEIAKADIGLDEEDINDTIEQIALPEETTTEEGGWGKAVIHSEDDENHNAVEVELNEVMVSEILSKLYTPFLVKVYRAIASMYGVIKTAIEKFSEDLGEFTDKWF